MLNIMVQVKLGNGGWILGLTNPKGTITTAIVEPNGEAYPQGEYTLRRAITKIEEMADDFSATDCDPNKYNFTRN